MLQNVLSRPLVIFGMMAMLALSASPMVNTLDLSSLIDTDEMFYYANILLVALGPVILIGIGFALAKYIISFVQRIFGNLG